MLESSCKLDHREKTKHDVELQHGTANVFCQKLAFSVRLSGCGVNSVNHKNDSNDDNAMALSASASASTIEEQADHEIALLCAGLEIVHRSSDVAIERNFEEIWREVLPLLSKMINRAFDLNDVAKRLARDESAIAKDKK